MAGSVTETYKTYDREKGRPNKVVASFACIGDASNGTLPDTALSTALMSLVTGMYLSAIYTKPGTPAPTDNYDITLIGATTTLDILGGVGANRDTANAEQAMPSISASSQKRLVNENLTLKFANQAVASAIILVQLIFVRN
jgi:hypothetical protein